MEIAQLEGHGLYAAQSKRMADRNLEVADREMLELTESRGGPDPRVAESMERVKAATASEALYAGCLARDHELMYALGVVWLALGFAAALAARK